MKINIEIPKIEDLKRVNELAMQVHEMHFKWRPDIFLDVDQVINEEEFDKKIKDEEIFIAKHQDEILGYITISIKEKDNRITRHRKQINIEAICVEEKSRGNGIGTALLNYAKKIGKEKNCTDMYLTVNEENEEAKKLYEKIGMRVKNIAYSMQIEGD